MELCLAAHADSALRHNLSHEAMLLAATGSRDYFKALAAALMTVGGVHAPLEQTYILLADADPVMAATRLLDEGRKVPGWGNGFVKEGVDPLWQACADALYAFNAELGARIDAITALLHARGKRLYPNPSCFTAAVAMCIGLPSAACGYIFVRGRLEAWTGDFLRVVS